MQKKAKMSLEKRHNLTGWAFLIPAALLIFIFCFYPMVQALILSFSKKGTGGSTFVGLANYQRILKDKTFQQCLFNTVFYFIIQVPVMLVLALGLVSECLGSPLGDHPCTDLEMDRLQHGLLSGRTAEY